jgi:hypothetical protein
MDEKGFMLGMLQASKRYFTVTEALSGRLKGVGQDGARDWVTVIASISQAGVAIPPAIIYTAATNNHQDSWYEELNTVDCVAHFITSPNGWTNDEIGFEWLTKVFDRHTRRAARYTRDYRLLFLDGHSSHINMRFIEFCDQNKILLMAYPPHSTHRLQPLDVSLFNPLANYYSQNLDAWLRISRGICPISKRYFWTLFKPAFDLAFSEKNIASSWRKTGLYPFDPEVVLSQVRSEDPRPASAASSASAFSSSSWKRAEEHIKATYGPPQTRAERKVFKTLDYLSAKSQHLQLQVNILEERISLQDKQSKRQQPLFVELRAKGDNKAIFFSPAKVQEAKDLLAQREREKEEEITRKRDEKAHKDQLRLQKQLEVAERREQRAIAARERARRLAEVKAAREEAKLQKQAEQQLLKDAKATKTPQRRSYKRTVRAEPYPQPVLIPQSVVVQELSPSRTRACRKLPRRYRD